MNRLAVLSCCAFTIAIGDSMDGKAAAMATDEAKPKARYVYKTIGERKLAVDVLYPPTWKPNGRLPAMVLWSGGGFRNGGTRQFRAQAQYFAKRGLVTIRAEYRDRTKDQATIEVCLKDAISSMRWVRRNAAMLGIDPGKIIASGGSAGGFLAAGVYTADKVHSPDDDLSVSPKPNAMVLFNPALEIRGTNRRLSPTAAPLRESLNALSPLRMMDDSMAPAIILIGSKDNFLAPCQDFCAKGRELGARIEIEVYEGQPHAFFNESPWTERTALRADEFLQALGYLGAEPKVDPPRGAPPGTRAKRRRRR